MVWLLALVRLPVLPTPTLPVPAMRLALVPLTHLSLDHLPALQPLLVRARLPRLALLLRR